jgi:hypothetical protein
VEERRKKRARRRREEGREAQGVKAHKGEAVGNDGDNEKEMGRSPPEPEPGHPCDPGTPPSGPWAGPLRGRATLAYGDPVLGWQGWGRVGGGRARASPRVSNSSFSNGLGWARG